VQESSTPCSVEIPTQVYSLKVSRVNPDEDAKRDTLHESASLAEFTPSKLTKSRQELRQFFMQRIQGRNLKLLPHAFSFIVWRV